MLQFAVFAVLPFCRNFRFDVIRWAFAQLKANIDDALSKGRIDDVIEKRDMLIKAMIIDQVCIVHCRDAKYNQPWSTFGLALFSFTVRVAPPHRP